MFVSALFRQKSAKRHANRSDVISRIGQTSAKFVTSFVEFWMFGTATKMKGVKFEEWNKHERHVMHGAARCDKILFSDWHDSNI